MRVLDMNHEVIFTWLGLPPASWPPDHYQLLGLNQGEGDIQRIEQEVHERMERVRRYQLSHPEQATEAMNRLAQALVCLTDPKAKKAYDAYLGIGGSATGKNRPAAAVVFSRLLPVRSRAGTTTPSTPAVLSRLENGQSTLPPAPLPEVVKSLPQMARLQGTNGEKTPSPATPPPSRARDGRSESGTRTVLDLDTKTVPPVAPTPAAENEPDEPVALPEPANGQALAPLVNGATSSSAILVSAPADPVFETARTSPAAKRGLGTKRALYTRIAHTRQLLRAWEQAGKYLGQPKRRLTRPAEETFLVNQLEAIGDLLEDFPAFLGQPGQPGQHVAAISRQQLVLQTFKMLDGHQREALARDWRAGRTLLISHRQFLRQELRALRKRTVWGRTARAVRALINDHPGYVILALGLLALLVALFHYMTGSTS
jgi:hypothetical protein